MNTGAILAALMLGVLLTAVASWAVAALYRRRMLALMRQSPAPRADAVAPAGVANAPVREPAEPDAGAWRAAERRQLIALVATGLLIGFSHAALALAFLYGEGMLSLGRTVTLGLAYAWPTALAWGLARRWSWGRTWAGVGVYLLAVLALVWWRSIDPQLGQAAGWLASLVLVPTAVTLLIGASPRIRSIAPYLLPLGLLLAAGTVGVQLWQVNGIDDPPRWVIGLVTTLGVWPAIVLISVLPWVVLAWPAWRIARGLARAYRDKRFSDLTYLVAAYWAVVLAASALPALQGEGWIGLVTLLPWLWLPITQWALRGWLAPRRPPPTLLVLRVFQQDAAVQNLFDRVIERWRLIGNTVLIAGTDLLSRTTDPDEVFAFLNRELAQRFIGGPADLAARLHGLDLVPDPDGRYRVNEFYCYDSTWQTALAALLQRADRVLMDLRGFQARNAGCRHELQALASAGHLQRVVVLLDERSDRITAQADAARAPAGRFVWVDGGRLGGRQIAAVMAALVGRAPQSAK